MRQHRPQRAVIPGRAGDEVLQLVVPAQSQLQRHRLQALALARAEQAAHIERRPGPPRLAAKHIKEWLQPFVQIPHHVSCHRHRTLTLVRQDQWHDNDAAQQKCPGSARQCPSPKSSTDDPLIAEHGGFPERALAVADCLLPSHGPAKGQAQQVPRFDGQVRVCG